MAKRRIALTSVPLNFNLTSQTSSAFRVPKSSFSNKIPLIQPHNRNDLPSKRSWDTMMTSLNRRYGTKRKKSKKISRKKEYQSILRGFTLKAAVKKRNVVPSKITTLAALVSKFPDRNKPVKLFPRSTLQSVVKQIPSSKKRIVVRKKQKGGVLPLAILPALVGATTLGLGGLGAGAGFGAYKLAGAANKKIKQKGGPSIQKGGIL